MEDVREFVAQTESEAVECAVRHFGVPRERLEVRVISAQLEISGLGGRVMVVARPVPVPVELGPTGAFLAGVLDRMQLPGKVLVAEREEEGVTQLLLSGPGLRDLTQRAPGTRVALTHLAQRAAELQGDAGSIVRIEAEEPGADHASSSGRRRGRDTESSGRGRERGRDRGRGRERGNRRDERSGPGPDRRANPDDEDGTRLAELARERAAEVLRSGEAALLPPLNSRERWFVHQALNEVDGVRGESDGEGRLKRIKIVRG